MSFKNCFDDSDSSDDDPHLPTLTSKNKFKLTIEGHIPKKYHKVLTRDCETVSLLEKEAGVEFEVQADGFDEEARLLQSDNFKMRFKIHGYSDLDVRHFAELADEFVGKNSSVSARMYLDIPEVEVTDDAAASMLLSSNLDLSHLESYSQPKATLPSVDMTKLAKIMTTVQVLNMVKKVDTPSDGPVSDARSSDEPEHKVSEAEMRAIRKAERKSTREKRKKMIKITLDSEDETTASCSSSNGRHGQKCAPSGHFFESPYKSTCTIAHRIHEIFVKQRSKVVLKTCLYYRSNSRANSVTYRYVCAPMLAIHASRLRCSLSQFKNNSVPSQIEFPVELEDTAISHLLFYIHGAPFKLPSADQLQFYYITAVYLEIDHHLIAQLRTKLKDDQHVSKRTIKQMDDYARNLPNPKLRHKFHTIRKAEELPHSHS